MCVFVRKSGLYYIYGGDTIVQDLKVFMNETDIMNGVFFLYIDIVVYTYFFVGSVGVWNLQPNVPLDYIIHTNI